MAWEEVEIACDRAESWRGEGPCRCSERTPVWWLTLRRAMAVFRSFVYGGLAPRNDMCVNLNLKLTKQLKAGYL
jgi:hypothetical protein